jgi:hypothetical protein
MDIYLVIGLMVKIVDMKTSNQYNGIFLFELAYIFIWNGIYKITLS